MVKGKLIFDHWDIKEAEEEAQIYDNTCVSLVREL